MSQIIQSTGDSASTTFFPFPGRENLRRNRQVARASSWIAPCGMSLTSMKQTRALPYVVLDAAMIKMLPRKIAAATGIDALAHAVECFTSNKANPLSDAFSLPALKMILHNIEAACDDPDAMEQKQVMQLTSFYAGVAITASGTTAVHALSYPLGGKYHIAHGVSNAILLVPVMRFNLKDEAFCARLAEAYDACYPENKLVGCAEKACALIDRMDEIVRHLDIPTSLKEFNVPASDLETLVDAGMQVTRLLVNNMRQVTADDARAIYRQIL